MFLLRSMLKTYFFFYCSFDINIISDDITIISNDIISVIFKAKNCIQNISIFYYLHTKYQNSMQKMKIIMHINNYAKNLNKLNKITK